MRFDHMAIFVTDLEEAIKLWRDVLGFNLDTQKMIPDGPEPGPDTLIYPALLDDILKHDGARSHMAILSSAEGAIIELQQVESPAIQKTPEQNLRYGHTGIHELGLRVDDIDGWYRKIKDAGYRMQTDYVWTVANFARSFIFYDHEGNMIQLLQQVRTAT